MLKTSLAFFMAFFCLAAPITALASQAKEPAQCLIGINEAVGAGDMAALEALADLDALLNTSLDAYLAEMRKPENQGKLPPLMALALGQLEGAGGNRIRGALLSEARAFVQNGVETGAFAGKRLDQIQSRGLLAPLFANASLGKKEIVWIGPASQVEGGWVAPFTVHDYGNDRDYAITGRFSGRDNGCVLTGIENIPELIRILQAEAEEAE